MTDTKNWTPIDWRARYEALESAARPFAEATPDHPGTLALIERLRAALAPQPVAEERRHVWDGAVGQSRRCRVCGESPNAQRPAEPCPGAPPAAREERLEVTTHKLSGNTPITVEGEHRCVYRDELDKLRAAPPAPPADEPTIEWVRRCCDVWDRAGRRLPRADESNCGIKGCPLVHGHGGFCDLDHALVLARALLRRMTESAPPTPAPDVDMAALFDRRAVWSGETFGPPSAHSPARVIAHIRKELAEIEADPTDLEEWVDVAILAMDGAWRSAGADGRSFVAAVAAKDAKNRARTWPDWRAADPTKAIEHVKAPDVEPAAETRLHDWLDIPHGLRETCRACGVLRNMSAPDVCPGEPAGAERGEAAAEHGAHAPNRMDAPDGPVCHCGQPSAYESGECAACGRGDRAAAEHGAKRTLGQVAHDTWTGMRYPDRDYRWLDGPDRDRECWEAAARAVLDTRLKTT